MLTLNDGRADLWQWDTGRTLAVDADCSQVHFSNKVFGRSVDVDVVDGAAIIPDVLLQTDKDLNVWAFVGTAENGYTKISKTFKVNRRNKPADYVFTPTEQTTIAEIAAIAQSVRDDADAGLFGGVQPDWNQNDSTAADYVRNRPFYTGDPVETVLLEESTVSFTDDGGGVYMGQLESTFSATVGDTYKVSWDGTVYECTCVDYYGPAIGNLSIGDDYPDTGEPFLFYVYDDHIEILTKDSSDSHTISVSGIVAPIVKIPAKYIDKNSSGYVVIHSKDTMTQQEAENYSTAISTKEVVFIIWNGMCISAISFGGATGYDLQLTTQNGERYFIKKNANGLFAFSDRKFSQASFPNGAATGDVCPTIRFNKEKIQISPGADHVGVESTGTLFSVQPNGTKSKAFEVLGNGEAVAPALILYSSTAGSTKKFRITVDDSGTLKATEVT